jgi:hypothetical protein
LLVPSCGQTWNDELRVPSELGPIGGQIDVGHIRRLFYALFYALSLAIYA